ncbi:DnaA regulatory inactivator Hda [Phocoenobacter skyensis]|uniref:DnaA regulatory inactivator Hda n=1 Tax=Phocoenobacter skyensis TaxID=97481 RepID=A0A1H7Y0J5_9PAST|nr:DnaA regulatory inactivator Hda [Pasteurella skyensis]MDP8079807.1 DnaA regulatory inactivator Hda [Pasteurella skyensis]MDP8085724.1 DnaA regulatory inactivator Hda [Pasteurella skyensis]MDP8171183.1 DnaA regulatory inactivator Hda [Pasteurella skyensis]MDP8174982.1 DnaA regulatory inactivator Hda [Pasteurella skyensis]MDP8185552.1 DnaA regulatory inactivator Hda [Pasteurella skyensis]
MILQLPLPIHQVDGETLENFYAQNNFVLLDSLRQNLTTVTQPFFYIWGSESCGKSHLLKAINNHVLIQQRNASYIPLEKSHYFSPVVLENADLLDVICLDDIHLIAGKEEWEETLFDLFNRIREQHSSSTQTRKTLLVISANCPPNQLAIKLPDLRSRLNWGEVYQLEHLTDEQKCEILQQRAYQKGLELSNEVASFLLKRLDRRLSSLINTLEILDQASLQAQRKLTVPFVKEVLGL